MENKERLDKILAHMGWGTRTEIKKMIKKGLVTVNGETVKDPSLKINPDEQALAVNGQKVVYQKYVYLMLNKPAGYVSATEDNRHRTVLDLLEPRYRAFAPFPVGRLDKDTEGLLILTNDGALGHFLTSPQKKVPKTYYALIAGQVTEEDTQAFLEGVILDDGYKTLPSQLTVLKSGLQSEVKVIIYEGKYHQVKRMFQARDKEVIFLKRLAMGNILLDSALAPGEYRELTEAELRIIRNTV